MASGSVSNATKVIVAVVVVAMIGVAWAVASRRAGTSIASYYPLEVGNTWSYQTTQRGHTSGALEVAETTRLGTMEQSVVGVSRLSSNELPIFEVSQKVYQTNSEDGSAPPTESVLHLSATPTAITLHAVDAEGAEGSDLPEPVSLLTDPPATEPVTIEQGSLQISLAVTSQEVEGIEVPAGSFPDALKIVAEGPVSGAVSDIPIHVGKITETTWFVRDVGVVRQDRALEYTLKSEDGGEIRVEESIERVLTDFSKATDD
ncbi:MAG: hypothetical protein AMJ62_08825 [Myxococcales bacterium SG8_38]|nr:MAG: hypothetical protein AMJ62_08825 [Myxococcales bacterium SG8_38]